LTPGLLELKRKTIDGMVDYMKNGGAEGESDPLHDPDFEAGYTQKHVDRCATIIDSMFAALASAPGAKSAEQILEIARAAVIKLNKLNDACDGSLIETGQREDLAELINAAAREAGLASTDDITEKWREW
jgi:hypothetical protein